MDPAHFLAALARDGDAFADACEAAGPAEPVVACPGWSVADLQWHLAEVLHFWRTIVGDQRDTWEGYMQPERPADAQLSAFYRVALADTLAVLSAADPSQPNWTWSNDHSAGFVIRRMAQETAVHNWDAQTAAGRQMSIDAALASDGIDEFLTHMLVDGAPDAPSAGAPDAPSAGAPDASPVAGSVHLHCTDVAGEWTLQPKPDGGFVVERAHAKGDAAIRGAASDILLALWRRRDLTTLDVVGDTAVAARFIAHTSLE